MKILVVIDITRDIVQRVCVYAVFLDDFRNLYLKDNKSILRCWRLLSNADSWAPPRLPIKPQGKPKLVGSRRGSAISICNKHPDDSETGDQ
jgi:hypothetical protein